jgi:arylsulfatase A-like enzyme
MNRRDFIEAAGAFAASQLKGNSSMGTPLTGDRPAAPARPNFLFIIADQQNIGALSAAGNPWLKTPAEDSIAAKGTRFTKSYCTNPLCSPSRSSLFTSRMAHETGVNTNDWSEEQLKKFHPEGVATGRLAPVPPQARLPEGMPSMGSLFRAAGYETAYSGKWHLPVGYPAYSKKADQKTIPGFDVLPMSGEMTKDRGDSGLYLDVHAADAAVSFLGKPHEKPFVLVCSILNPHDICHYPENPETFDALCDANAPLPPVPPNLNALTHEPEALASSREGYNKARGISAWTDEGWRKYRASYYRLTEIADAHVGRVLAALEQSHLASNTIVIFTADHGELMGAHKLVTKMKLYEESAAVPLLISAPGVTATARVNDTHLVSGLDILPTMCDYAGIPAPDSFEGRSLRPVLEGKTAPWRDFVISAVTDKSARMLRTSQYKYVVYGNGGNPEQLFDMDADPYEMKNLAADPSLKDVLSSHRRMLAKWMKETKDPFAATPNGTKML